MNKSDRERFRSTPESEMRVLLLIDAFSRARGGKQRQLEGRVKLAKLDFLLRYPNYLARALVLRGVTNEMELQSISGDAAPIENRMVRYRYGPWDPAYYAILGALVGRGLIETLPIPVGSGSGFRTTDRGAVLANELREDGSFATIDERTAILRRSMDLSGSTLKNLIYQLPEIKNATWKAEL